MAAFHFVFTRCNARLCQPICAHSKCKIPNFCQPNSNGLIEKLERQVQKIWNNGPAMFGAFKLVSSWSSWSIVDFFPPHLDGQFGFCVSVWHDVLETLAHKYSIAYQYNGDWPEGFKSLSRSLSVSPFWTRSWSLSANTHYQMASSLTSTRRLRTRKPLEKEINERRITSTIANSKTTNGRGPVHMDEFVTHRVTLISHPLIKGMPKSGYDAVHRFWSDCHKDRRRRDEACFQEK